MIEQQGRVVAVQGDQARVRLGARAGCSACDAGRGCGAGVFGRLLGRGTVDLLVPNAIGARPGHRVGVGIPESLFLQLAWGLYGWPLLGGLAGVIGAHAIFAGILGANAAALDAVTLVAGLVVGAVGLSQARRRLPDTVSGLSLELVARDDASLDCARPELQ